MESDVEYARAFNALIAESDMEPHGIEARVHAMSNDRKLYVAMSDALVASVYDLFPADEGDYHHDYAAACERLTDVVIALQFEYGISEQDAARAADYARARIEGEARDLG